LADVILSKYNVQYKENEPIDMKAAVLACKALVRKESLSFEPVLESVDFLNNHWRIVLSDKNYRYFVFKLSSDGSRVTSSKPLSDLLEVTNHPLWTE
jgi:hypothetical protein